MTVRVYVYQHNGSPHPMRDYMEAHKDAENRWEDRIQWGLDENKRLAIWLEFETEVDAALFKLTEL